MARKSGAGSDGYRDTGLDRRGLLAGLGAVGLGGFGGCQGGAVGSTPTATEDPFAGVEAERYQYGGRAEDADWRADARDRIERHRTADLAVTVVDEEGATVEGATVDVTMQAHEFNWGTAANGEKVAGDDTDDGERFRTVLAEEFNYATVENRLRAFRWRGSEEDREEAREMVAWLNEQGHDVRGHALFWEDYEWMDIDPEQSPEAVNEAMADRITERANEFEGQLADWDCQNHPFHRQAVRRDVGKERVFEWWATAHEADTEAAMGVNEMNILTRYPDSGGWLDDLVEWVEWLQSEGVTVDAIGCQCHAPIDNLADIPDVLDRLDTLDERFDLPVYVSEFHVPLWTGDAGWDRASEEQQHAQADYVRDFLTAVFSHPVVETVVHWNFWAGWAWRPDSCFYAEDWTLRPHGRQYQRLVFEEWWTDESGETDDSGTYATSGFNGEYEVTAAEGDRSGSTTVTLSEGGASVEIQLS